jgi:hypothetical protein
MTNGREKSDGVVIPPKPSNNAELGSAAETVEGRTPAKGNSLERGALRTQGRDRKKRIRSEEGAVQGGSISPLLANLYLHYVFDLWTHQWRRKPGRGEMIVVRCADDFVVGFEHERDAEAFLAALRERFARFGLELHPDKTRILEFGRYAAVNRAERGLGKPETFDFLGFTHICAKTLRAVVLGHTRYYGVPGNGAALQVFRRQISWLWGRSLRRRGNRRVPAWQRLRGHLDRWLPHPHICHPWPSQRLAVRTQGRSRMR